MVDRRPALIARCTTPADVAAAIRHGRECRARDRRQVRRARHPRAGRPGGRPVDRPVADGRGPRRPGADGGRPSRAARSCGTLDRTTDRHGLATTAGNVSHTGVGGLTLGGGMGWLARQFGLACDNVETYTVVTADGADGPRERDGASGPVLGPAWRRRQLRRRHRVRVPAPPDDRPGACRSSATSTRSIARASRPSGPGATCCPRRHARRP